jgi:pyruvate dehydrogenase E2 component (dihydrolipoamide acetyltransferase)
MQIEICMPHLGITMEYGTITGWLKREGDHVGKGEAIVEFETEKLVNTIESPAEGTITRLLFPEGEEVKCGTPIAYLAVGEGVEIVKPAAAAAPLAQEKKEPKEIGDKKVLRIVPTAGSRKMIGTRMRESLERSPQGTSTCRANVTALLKYKKARAENGEDYTFTDFIVKAAALALKKHPILNSSLIEDSIYVYESVNVGVAVAVGDNLLVPVVRDADKKTLSEVSADIKAMVERAKEGTIKGEELTGGTFTITSLGMYNVDYMTPLINIPEAAILGVGRYRKEPLFNAKKQDFEPADMVPLSLTIDHAVMDGAPAAQFLETLSAILADPEQYLL